MTQFHPDVVEDEIPDVPDEPITRTGDLWICGRHKVLCGDSTKAEDVARVMGGEKFEIMITSPPYRSGDGGYKSDYHGKVKKFYISGIDKRSEGDYIEFCNAVLRIAANETASEKTPVVWNVMYTAQSRMAYGCVVFGDGQPFTVKETICWDKGNGFPSASRGILSRNWELVFVLSLGGDYYTTQGENEVRWGKWDIGRPVKQEEELGAVYPVELAARALRNFSKRGVVCYDPFLGSGTTLIAAEQLGRRCYGIEICEKYVDVVLQRWYNLTGKDPIREDGAKWSGLKKK